MPRIRTIKPQFWTDEKVGKLSFGARLLFIATWNLADDEGILIWDARYLKGQVFPYDNVQHQMKRWMADLENIGLIRPYSTSTGGQLALISHATRHQVISRPSPSLHQLPVNFPDFAPKYTKNSMNTPVVSNEDSVLEMEMEMEMEGIGNKEGKEGKNTPISTENNEDKKTAFGEFMNVLLTDSEHDKLVERFGGLDTGRKIEDLSQGIASKGYKYKDHYATILSWDRKDKKKEVAATRHGPGWRNPDKYKAKGKYQRLVQR